MDPLFLLQCIFCFVLFSYALFNILAKKPSGETKTTKPKCYPIIGCLPEFLQNRHRFLDWSTEILIRNPTKTFEFKRFGIHGITTANPANLEHILKTHFENYPKGERSIVILQDFLGNGIFNTNGDLWKLQRKTASYEFSTKSLRNFIAELVNQEIERRLIPLLETYRRNNRTLDLQEVLDRFAFDNVCRVAFNKDAGCLCLDDNGILREIPEFAIAFEEASKLSAERFMYATPMIWKIKKMLHIGSEKKLAESIKFIRDFAMKIIHSRNEEKSCEQKDLLSRFMRLGDHTDEFLCDIVISFILAGRETTPSALTWFFWLLSFHPEIENSILQELKSIRTQFRNCDQTFRDDELREMHYLHASLSESMRLYPPVPLNSRCCQKDDFMPDGLFVKKNWIVSYNVYATGRIKEIWGEDCLEFKPERWLENGIFRPENQFKFPVFHGGPRLCLGKDMAYIQMKSIVAAVVERFVLEISNKIENPEKQVGLTLRMGGGLTVKVRERKRVN